MTTLFWKSRKVHKVLAHMCGSWSLAVACWGRDLHFSISSFYLSSRQIEHYGLVALGYYEGKSRKAKHLKYQFLELTQLHFHLVLLVRASYLNGIDSKARETDCTGWEEYDCRVAKRHRHKLYCIRWGSLLIWSTVGTLCEFFLCGLELVYILQKIFCQNMPFKMIMGFHYINFVVFFH